MRARSEASPPSPERGPVRVTPERRGRPPGPQGLPVLGVALDYGREPFDFLLRSAREHGDVTFLKLGGYDIFVVSEPSLIAQVLVHRRERYRKNQFLRRARVIFGDGLLTAEGEHWSRQRRQVQPAFSTHRVMGYVAGMSARGEAHLGRWRDGEVRDVHQDMMRLTLDIALRTLFGADIRQETADRIGEAFTAVATYFAETRSRPLALPLWLPTPGNRRFVGARAALHEVVDGIIEARRASGVEVDDLLGMLLSARDADGQGRDDAQLRDELITLLFAGHETTALGLTYALWHLARAPVEADRVAEEAQRVLGDAAPNIQHLPQLKVTERALREALRLHPPSYAIAREALVDDELDGWKVPAGSMVVLPQWVVHRDPRFYSRPEVYDPSRWTKEFKASLPTFAWFPFGGGPRVCVGAGFAMTEMSLVLASAMRRWRVSPLDDAPLRMAAATAARPLDPVLLKVQLR